MNSLRVLVLGTDKLILHEGSVSSRRQIDNFKNFEYVKIVVLGSNSASTFQSGHVHIVSYGATNRIVSFVKSFFILLRDIRKNTYDIIYTQDVLYCGIAGYLLSRFCKTILITQLHGDYLDNPLWINQRFENRFLNISGKFLIKKSDYVRCVSSRIATYVIETLGKDSNRVVSLPIGVNGDEFNPQGVDNGHVRNHNLIFCGRLIEEKQPLFCCEIMIPILQKYPDFTAVFIGEGKLKSAIVKKFTDAGLTNRLEMPGFLDTHAVAQYYKNGFALIHTAFWEGWGLPMVEASCCGLPVLTTDTGCAGEVIINDLNGVVIQGSRSDEYVAALEKMIVNKEFYGMLCANGSRLGSKWTSTTMQLEIEKFLEHAVEK
ncbi:MAG: kanE [Candidatus Kaiserbacteria bacterium]|nr:kanE [Candidatus Kaiserbacteria bacterium]